MKLIKKYKNTILFILAFVILAVIFTIITDQFLTLNNFKQLLRHTSNYAIVSLGLTFVVIVGHSDMSFHYSCNFGAMTMSYLITLGFSPVPSILVGLLVMIVPGLINGFAISKLKLPDMVMTIGTGLAFFGFSYIYSDGSYLQKNYLGSGIVNFNNMDIIGIPLPVIIVGLIYIVCFFVLSRSKHGRYFYALGENRRAAVFSGINEVFYITVAFILCAVFAGLANEFSSAARGMGRVNSGVVFLMPAYSSVFLGKAIFGKPSVLGSLCGSLFLGALLNGFTLMAAPYYTSDLITAVVLVFALSISGEVDFKTFQVAIRNKIGTKKWRMS